MRRIALVALLLASCGTTLPATQAPVVQKAAPAARGLVRVVAASAAERFERIIVSAPDGRVRHELQPANPAAGTFDIAVTEGDTVTVISRSGFAKSKQVKPGATLRMSATI